MLLLDWKIHQHSFFEWNPTITEHKRWSFKWCGQILLMVSKIESNPKIGIRSMIRPNRGVRCGPDLINCVRSIKTNITIGVSSGIRSYKWCNKLGQILQMFLLLSQTLSITISAWNGQSKCVIKQKWKEDNRYNAGTT